ncbi:hypothetical protein VNO78_05621 [Psophocarpus tetragonolobus]|uniref:Uncharacterized protein n=1 Tax=Psophocarpus tetragonolobus TaxID=3891 RepID=A0AAN9SRC8_PSOTE
MFQSLRSLSQKSRIPVASAHISLFSVLLVRTPEFTAVCGVVLLVVKSCQWILDIQSLHCFYTRYKQKIVSNV